MKRFTLILLALGVFISIVSHIFSERAKAEEEKERLKQRVAELDATLEVVRTDPHVYPP
jgi:hypothetical protein